MNHSELSSTYQNEFERRNNGQRLQNPSLDWQTVSAEVPALDNRNAARGYACYAQERIYSNASHEQAMETVVKTMVWR